MSFVNIKKSEKKTQQQSLSEHIPAHTSHRQFGNNLKRANVFTYNCKAKSYDAHRSNVISDISRSYHVFCVITMMTNACQQWAI